MLYVRKFFHFLAVRLSVPGLTFDIPAAAALNSCRLVDDAGGACKVGLTRGVRGSAPHLLRIASELLLQPEAAVKLQLANAISSCWQQHANRMRSKICSHLMRFS